MTSWQQRMGCLVSKNFVFATGIGAEYVFQSYAQRLMGNLRTAPKGDFVLCVPIASVGWHRLSSSNCGTIKCQFQTVLVYGSVLFVRPMIITISVWVPAPSTVHREDGRHGCCSILAKHDLKDRRASYFIARACKS